MMLYDAKTGELLALIDSDWITTMRTGAVAAVSARALRKKMHLRMVLLGLVILHVQLCFVYWRTNLISILMLNCFATRIKQIYSWNDLKSMIMLLLKLLTVS